MPAGSYGKMIKTSKDSDKSILSNKYKFVLELDARNIAIKPKKNLHRILRNPRKLLLDFDKDFNRFLMPMMLLVIFH